MNNRATTFALALLLGLTTGCNSRTTADAAPAVAESTRITRGPYLQSGTVDGVTIVWRTESAAACKVRYGRRPFAPWEGEAETPSGTQHQVALRGLRSDTFYYYEVVSADQRLVSGDEYTFRTQPLPGAPRAFRFLAWGDSGTGDSLQFEVARNLNDLLPAPALSLGLGDLVYPVGGWDKYDPNFFSPYRQILRKQVLWPAMGNHDSSTEGGAPFVDAFHIPRNSGAPGSPSETERYYSFDHGPVHFVCLDLWTSDKSVGGPQWSWALADLDAAVARGTRWTVVFNHSPPYTKGSHDSDAENDLVFFRENWIPELEARGVDVLLAGHSHNYERSYLVHDDAILQSHASDYLKTANDQGTLYVVSGCGGGKSGSGNGVHPLMANQLRNDYGSLVFDVSFDELRGYFVKRNGRMFDPFTLRKAPDNTGPWITGATTLNVSGTDVRLAFNERLDSATARNHNNYAILGGASVIGAALLDDGRTVLLQTSAPTSDKVQRVRISGIKDLAGNTSAPGTAISYVSRSPGASIPASSTWRYFEGTSHPGPDWTTLGYSDSGWNSGTAGFGQGDGDDATQLNTAGNFATVYLRRKFQVADSSAVTGLTLSMDFDDGFVAYLNGTEVARFNVPQGQNHNTTANASHEAGSFEQFELTHLTHLLVDGNNILAVEGHNETLFNNDFSLHPKLEVRGNASGGNAPPHAVLTADVETGNAPFRVRFSSTGSFDAESGVELRWNFGDGSDPELGATAAHTYTAPGTYVATLTATDGAGLEDFDSRVIHVHDRGEAPEAQLTASRVEIEAGESVSFQGSGSDPDGGNVLLAWDFGDYSAAGNLATGTSPTHRFNTGGLFDVTLIVTDDEGSQTARHVTIGVGEAPPDDPVDPDDPDDPVDPDDPDDPIDPDEPDDPDDGDGGGVTPGGDAIADDNSGGGCFGTAGRGPGGGDPSFPIAMLGLMTWLAWSARRGRGWAKA